MKPHHWIIADNQDITFTGMKALLQDHFAKAEIRRISHKTELTLVIRTFSQCRVILDYTRFDFADLSELLRLNTGYPEVQWLLFSDDLSPDLIRMALSTAPAFSYCSKDAAHPQLVNALLALHDGQPYRDEFSTQILIQPPRPKKVPSEALTPSEKSILHEIALGKTTKEIAAEKFLSFHTVNTHRKNIFRKIEVNNMHEARKYAIRMGILPTAEYFI